MTRPLRALNAGALGAVVVLLMGSCADLDLIAKDEQANRLQSAAAFGALGEDIRIVTAAAYPGSDNLDDVARWLSQSSAALAITDERFGVWTNVTKQLTFVPEDSPGPTREMIEGFDAAFVSWTATASASHRSVRACLENKKPKATSRCLEAAEVSSVAERTRAQALLNAQATTIDRSLAGVRPGANNEPAAPDTSG
jgi:hypothetical protein